MPVPKGRRDFRAADALYLDVCKWVYLIWARIYEYIHIQSNIVKVALKYCKINLLNINNKLFLPLGM